MDAETEDTCPVGLPVRWYFVAILSMRVRASSLELWFWLLILMSRVELGKMTELFRPKCLHLKSEGLLSNLNL